MEERMEGGGGRKKRKRTRVWSVQVKLSAKSGGWWMNVTKGCRVITSPSCLDKRRVIPSVPPCRTFIPTPVWLLSLFACCSLSTVHEGFYSGVSFGVCVCVKRAFCVLPPCALWMCRPCENVCVSVRGAESLMKFNSLTWSFSLSRPLRKREEEGEGKRDECSVTAKRC